VIFIGIGANLPHPEHGPPRETCEVALAALTSAGLHVLRRSRWYESEPVPPSDQPWFVNGVAEVATRLAPADLLERLHRVEAAFGRVRRRANEARVLAAFSISTSWLMTDASASRARYPYCPIRAWRSGLSWCCRWPNWPPIGAIR
jgi:2-amino-4-hydroxy-6-hydroxymethyldihydropteridine diphosphokinase